MVATTSLSNIIYTPIDVPIIVYPMANGGVVYHIPRVESSLVKPSIIRPLRPSQKTNITKHTIPLVKNKKNIPCVINKNNPPEIITKEIVLNSCANGCKWP